MKSRMMVFGSYVLIGVISCIALAAVAGNMGESEPSPVVAVRDKVPTKAAKGSSASAASDVPSAKPKAKRGRKKASAKRVDTPITEASATDVGATAPRKTRARRSRKAKANQVQQD